MSCAAVMTFATCCSGADHFAPVFHRDRNGDMVLAPDEPAGDRIVELVVDATGDQ